MKNNVWVAATIQAAHEILYFLPFLIIFNHFLVHVELAVTALGVLICYLLGFALGQFKLIRFLEWLCCIVIATIFSFLFVDVNWSGYSFILLAFIAMNRGIRFRYAPWHLLFRANAFIFCIVIYFATPIMFLFYSELMPDSPYLYWGGLYCLIHALFTLNNRQLLSAAQNKRERQSITQHILRVNRLGTAIIIIVLIIMINIDQISRIVKSWLLGAFNWINGILSKPPEPEQPIEMEQLPLDNGGMIPPPPMEKGPISKFFDLFFYYGAYVIEVLLAIGILYVIIFKLLIPLFSKFISNAKLTRELEYGYSDEEEMLEAPKLGNWLRELVKRNPSNQVPEDNKERVRYFYKETLRAAIKRGQEFRGSQTPLEIEKGWKAEKAKHRLPSRLIALYNKARYGQSIITDEEMKYLKENE
jgi:hypothetical protein